MCGVGVAPNVRPRGTSGVGRNLGEKGAGESIQPERAEQTKDMVPDLHALNTSKLVFIFPKLCVLGGGVCGGEGYVGGGGGVCGGPPKGNVRGPFTRNETEDVT